MGSGSLAWGGHGSGEIGDRTGRHGAGPGGELQRRKVAPAGARPLGGKYVGRGSSGRSEVQAGSEGPGE